MHWAPTMFFDTHPKVSVEIAQSGEIYACATNENLLKGMLKLYEPIRRAREKRNAQKTAVESSQNVSGGEWALAPGQAPVPSPFGPNSIVFSAGWMDTGREKHLAALKQRFHAETLAAAAKGASAPAAN